MLKHRSTPQAGAKWPVALLLIIAAAIPFCNESMAKGTGNGRSATWMNNKVTYAETGPRDTIYVVDPVSGEEIMRVQQTDPVPLTLNGRKIYTSRDGIAMPQQYAGKGSIAHHIFSGTNSTLSKLPDGSYRLGIQDVIVDEKGKVAFYQFSGVFGADFNNKPIALGASVIDRLRSQISALMNAAPQMSPGRYNGKAVVANADIITTPTVITVRGHLVTLTTTQ